MFGILQNEYKLVNAVDFVFDILNERAKGIGNVVDESVRNPVRGDVNEVLQLLDTPANILWMRSASEVELQGLISGRKGVAERDTLTESVPSRNTMMYILRGSRYVGLYGSWSNERKQTK